MTFFNFFANTIDSGIQIDVIYTDIKKAFDTEIRLIIQFLSINQPTLAWVSQFYHDFICHHHEHIYLHHNYLVLSLLHTNG